MNDPIEATDPMEGRRRCTAYARSTGQRCGNAPIKGGTVCKFHGGGAPAVRQKAKLRLAALVEPAIGTLAREMMKAEKSADRQRAANSILDRGGMPRASHVRGQMSLEESKELLVQRILEMRAKPLPAPAPLEVLDAEIIDEDKEP